MPNYPDTNFDRQTPNEVLVATCPISDIEHIVEALDADVYTAVLLEIQEGTACLCLVRRTRSDDRLISYAQLFHPGARYKLRSAMRPTNKFNKKVF